MTRKSKVRFRGIPVAAVLLAVCTPHVLAQGPTFTVNSTDDLDDGTCNAVHCSLREAINAANGTVGEVLIAFDIPGAGPHTIQPTSELPTLLVTTHINGATEPDFDGTPVIEIDGGGVGGVRSGIAIAGSNSTVQALIVNRVPGFGIEVLGEASGTVIEGCFIGTNNTGTVAFGFGNEAGIILWGGTGHRVGGASPSQRNVIAGNGFGIILGELSRDNRVFGNYIGTNPAGDPDLNNQTGVDVRGAENVIGGEEPGEGNVISGNGTGVRLKDANSTGNYVVGNVIGTDPTGSFAVGNGVGIYVEEMVPGTDSNNTIGGTNSAARNVISGNVWGIRIEDGSGIDVLGNHIGTDQTGSVAIPNEIGIILVGPGNRVGHSAPGAANLISGNSSHGIRLWEWESMPNRDNVIQGNFIGVDASGTANLGNGGAGILLEGGVSNTIGGEDQGAGNTIAHNGGGGIVLVGAGAGNLIRGNSIFSNNGLGIDLRGLEGVDPNDAGDSDTGPNQLMNYPLVMAAPTQGAILAKALMHNSLPNEPMTFEFFENESCDPSGHGEGKTPLFTTSITSASDGDASMSGVTSGVTHLTATATDGSGNTSEFSECVALTDFSMAVSPESTAVSAGSAASFTVTLTPLGGPFSDAVELVCSGNPTGTTCTFTEPELIPYENAVGTVMTVITQGPQGASSPISIPWDHWVGWVVLLGCALIIPAVVMWNRPLDAEATRRRALPALIAVAALILIYPLGCGSEATSPPPGGTPAGTYQLTITGTWETLSHTTTATLVVN